MHLKKVLAEIENEGEYWRGDTRAWIANGKFYCEYLPKKGYSPSELIKGKETNGLKLEFSHFLSIEAPRERIKNVINLINSIEYPNIHITKRAGCMIKIQNGEVVKIGDPKILYCPIAKERYGRARCKQCHDVIPLLKEEFEGKIRDGMFTDNRKICESKARYTYGASEILMDALGEVIEACVIVCDGVGTLVVTNPEVVQGIGEKMTGVFYTSPHKKLIEKLDEFSFVVFPETARINQVEGVKAARRWGFRKIAVTTAHNESKNLKKIREMDDEIITLALCTSGIEKETAEIIREYADLAWACGSKYVRKIVGPSAWVQLGTRLPVFILTERGFRLGKPRIISEFGRLNLELSLDLSKKYHNLKEVDKLPVRSENEPFPLI